MFGIVTDLAHIVQYVTIHDNFKHRARPAEMAKKIQSSWSVQKFSENPLFSSKIRYDLF